MNALFTHNDVGDLVAVNDFTGTPAPRFFVGLTEEGSTVRFRDDIDIELRRELEQELATKSGQERFDPAGFESVLNAAAPVQRTWQGPAFVCDTAVSYPSAVEITEANAYLLDRYLRPWREDAALGRRLFAVVVNDCAVSVCGSVRSTYVAHEAGVETAHEFRGRGYAVLIVAAWADAIRRAGYVPLYSTSWQNQASRSVAGKLGLRCFGADLHIT